MLNTLKQVFRSPRFLVGFIIFITIFLTVIIYPLIVTVNPLDMVGNGNFFKPGTYVNVSETMTAKKYTLNVDVSSASKLDRQLDETQRSKMSDWLVRFGGVDESEIDTSDAAASSDEYQSGKDVSSGCRLSCSRRTGGYGAD